MKSQEIQQFIDSIPKQVLESPEFINHIPDEALERLTFSTKWQYGSENDAVDADGVNLNDTCGGNDALTRIKIQDECWAKFHKNPQMNTAIRGIAGRLTGLGFSSTSGIWEIQEAIEEIELDPRNRLYNFWPKYMARAYTEGEHFQVATVHSDGFIELDFLDPCTLQGGDDNTGIFFHPFKTTMPLMYNVVVDWKANPIQIPSIYLGRYPDLYSTIAKDSGVVVAYQKDSRTSRRAYKSLGGFKRFIIAWDKGFVTRRAVGYVRTVLEWLNYYESLKRYEIDHKKSSGAYLWVFKITEAKAFKQWLAMSDTDKRQTGIMAKKVPGGSLVLPPGIELQCVNPNLTSIKDQDTDILSMVSSGLNEPEDVMSGQSKGSFSSVKASRGPMADRIADEVAYFERFLLHDFWGPIFFLKSSVTNFPKVFKVDKAISFKNKKPIIQKIKRRPEQLIDISFPVSDSIEYTDRATAFLGSKHGPITETLGIQNSEIARKMGFGGYARARLEKATEDDTYPDLVYSLDAESVQEQIEAEPSQETKAKRNADKKASDTAKVEDTKAKTDTK